MSTLEALAGRRPEGGFAAAALLRDDREWAACWACRRKHPLRTGNADHDYADFAARHPTSRGCIVLRLGPEQLERSARRAERRKRAMREAVAGFLHNASVLEAFQGSDQSLDLTGFNSLASSVTAGWCSTWIDNSANLYLEYLSEIVLANVNTAAAGQKALYVWTCGVLNTTDTLPTNTAGNAVTNSAATAAALTFLDFTANPTGFFGPIQAVPYITTNKWAQAGAFPMSQAFNGWPPRFFWFPFINNAGPTIAASGNSWKYRGVYATVA